MRCAYFKAFKHNVPFDNPDLEKHVHKLRLEKRLSIVCISTVGKDTTNYCSIKIFRARRMMIKIIITKHEIKVRTTKDAE